MRTTPLYRASGSRRPLAPDAVYALIAAVTLGMGLSVYLFARPPLELLPFAWNSRVGAWLGPLGGVLPEFLHVFAFILLTAAVVPEPSRLVSICGFWLGIETFFELGQHPSLAPSIAAAVPQWFEQLPVFDRTASYFLHGTFDPWDVVTMVLGTLAAYLTLTWIAQRNPHHAPNT